MKILGINTRCYPNEYEGVPPFKITVVLVEGEIGDYAAYVGHGSPEWIARRGDKLGFIEAKVHFPSIEEDRYRI